MATNFIRICGIMWQSAETNVTSCVSWSHDHFRKTDWSDCHLVSNCSFTSHSLCRLAHISYEVCRQLASLLILNGFSHLITGFLRKVLKFPYLYKEVIVSNPKRSKSSYWYLKQIFNRVFLFTLYHNQPTKLVLVTITISELFIYYYDKC